MIPLQSEKIDAIAAALVAAQAEMTNAPRNAVNTFLGNSYANLAAVREACLGPLNSQGIALTQVFVPEVREPALFFETTKIRKDGGKSIAYTVPTQVLGNIRTQLTHVSGQWIASEVPVAAPWGDAQTLGGMISYLRRYALQLITGLATEDDDGHGASSHDRPRQQQSQPQPQPKAREAAVPVERGDAFDEFDDGGSGANAAPADAGSRRLASREERKAAYRADYPPTQPQSARRPDDNRQHSWPPRNGRGLYAAVADSPARKWFDSYGGEQGWPERFADWSEDEVAQACQAYDYENQRRAATANAGANGHAPAGSRA